MGTLWYRDTQMTEVLSQPINKRADASHPIKLFHYGTARYRNFPTHTNTTLYRASDMVWKKPGNCAEKNWKLCAASKTMYA